MMKTYTTLINDHYGHVNLGENILTAYEQAGKDIHSLNRDDISSFDEFHIRGRDASRELAQLVDLQAGEKVLDIGSGVGGPARTLAGEFGCEVVGLDLVEEYCRTADMLTARVGLSDRVTFRQGNVLDMPFDDGSFDVVWSQHMTMNIENKMQLFREVRRVLRPGGRFVIYEICAGPASTIYFPVPWANDSTINFLVTPGELQQMLGDSGFTELAWKDVSKISLEWFQGMIAAMAAMPKDKPALGLNLLMGKTTPEKAKNLTRNLAEDRVRVIQGVLK
jgi:SAM-dependent methyltransferase